MGALIITVDKSDFDRAIDRARKRFRAVGEIIIGDFIRRACERRRLPISDDMVQMLDDLGIEPKHHEGIYAPHRN